MNAYRVSDNVRYYEVSADRDDGRIHFESLDKGAAIEFAKSYYAKHDEVLKITEVDK